MRHLALALVVLGFLLFIERIYYHQLLEENSNKYFQMYAAERNYILETERIVEQRKLQEARNRELIMAGKGDDNHYTKCKQSAGKSC